MKEVYKDKINFILPDFLNYDACAYHLSTCRNHPEAFKDNLNVFGFRGSFPGSRWCEKDKKFDKFQLSLQELRDLKEKYKSLNTHLFIEFNKEEIKERDLDDEYSNLIVDIFDDKNNYVYCKNKMLSDYIKEKYHQINVVGDYDNNLSVDNKLTLVNPLHNKDKDLFNNTKYNLLIYPDGGFIRERRWMFKHTIKDSTLQPINPKKDRYYSDSHSISFYQMKQEETYLSWGDVIKYKEKGINYFILSGSGIYNIAGAINLVDFIYKDEYKADGRLNHFSLLIETKKNEVTNNINGTN